ncbi:MAG: hypothetical protein Q7R46_00645, partial [bacterium]|nr:hypothetical protein [bacterium]
KDIKVSEIDNSFFDKFFDKSNAADLEKIESKIANLLGIESWKVAVSHIVEKDRFIPRDITFFDGSLVYSLKEQDPSYFDLLAKELNKYLCVRICVAPEYRSLLFSKWRQALAVLSKHIGYKLA